MKHLKPLSIFTALVVLAMSICGCTQSQSGDAPSAKDEKIAVIQLVSNDAFDQMRDGFVETMKADGYTDDNFTLMNANGDQSQLPTLVQNAISSNVDLIVTVATPATAAVVSADTDIPNLFIAVSDPIGNKIIADWNTIDHNSTGTSNPIPADKIMELASTLTPGYSTVGMMCNPAEKNAVSTCNAVKKYLDEQGISYIQKDVVDPATDVVTAVDALIAENVDIIFVPNDSSLQSYMGTIAGKATEAKIPTYGSSAVMPATGALGAVAISDFNIGAKTAEMAKQLFAGTDIKDIPSIPVEADETSINKTTASKLGIEIPADLKVDKEYE